MTDTKSVEREIEVLDREAREALDRLADKREELERQHRSTELAAERQRERRGLKVAERERLRTEEAETRARELVEDLRTRRLDLEERAEEQATELSRTLSELIALDPEHHRALEAVGEGVRPREAFERTLLFWTIGRFSSVLPGLGSDYLKGKPLAERDELVGS